MRRFSTNYAILCIVADGVFAMLSLRLAQLVRPFIAPYLIFVKDIANPQAVTPLVYFFLARRHGLESAIAFHWIQDVARFLTGF